MRISDWSSDVCSSDLGGYWMHSASTPLTCPAKGPRTICVPGAGGSLGWADPDAKLAVAFCHNRMIRPKSCEDHPLTAIADVLRDALGLRSDERRVGKECVSKCRSRRTPVHKKKKQQHKK